MRPIFIALVGYMIGIIWGLYFNISIVPFAILFLVILHQIQQSDLKKKRWIRYLKVFLPKNSFILLIGCCMISNTIVVFQNNSYQTLYKAVEKAEFVATVISDETRKEYKSVYQIKIESVNQNKTFAGTKLLLHIKEENVLQYGDYICFRGEYKKPQSARNENGFDHAEYLKTVGVYGMVETTKNAIEIKKTNHLDGISLLAHRAKHCMLEQCNNILPQKNAALLQGILLGEINSLEEETITYFRNSSLYHMLAVSGSHISYIILACSFLFTKLSTRKQKSITILVLFFFMFVTSFSLSVVRACIMGILMLLAEIFYRKSDFINNISMALLLILLQNPYAIRSLSVLLSFGGTIGIVIFSKDIKRMLEKEGILIKQNKIKECIKENIILTIAAQWIVTPIILVQFHTISATFVLSNGVASMFIGPITILGFLAVFLSFVSMTLAKWIAVPLNLFLSLLQQIAKFTANLPLSNLYVVSIPFVCILFYYSSFFLIHFYQVISQKARKRKIEDHFLKYMKKVTIKKIGILILLFLVIFYFLPMYTKSFTIYFIDVGQGDSCLVITKQNKTILIDGGGSEFSSFDVGEKILIPYLLQRRVRTLDYVMISHLDTDHCGGILSLLQHLTVKTVIMAKQEENSENYQKLKKIITEKNIKVKIVKAGDSIKIDKDTHLQVLWPQEKQITENGLNNNSIVAKLVYGNTSMLFTGDIEELAETEIIKKQEEENQLKSTILKVAHHGSKTSSTEKFLNLVQPKLALIGVGENNTFGHPHKEVLQRLKNRNCKIYRTDQMGEIIITIYKKGKIKTKIR